MLCWLRGLSSARKHNSDSIEPEVKAAMQSLWAPYACKPTDRKGIMTGWVGDLNTKKK
jgi:hypothetical protein